mgnify:CR=1 FL=1
MKLNIITIIPARMGSSRFPNKPMALINNIPMVEMVYRNASKSKLSNKTYVATCDKVIFDHFKMNNANVVMTSKKHQRASDRCAEALSILEKKYKKKFDIMILVQGDEPMINYKMIDSSIKPFLEDKKVQIVNLFAKINTIKEFKDKNCIKVVMDNNKNAMYFSREPIPYQKTKEQIYANKQICVIPFKRDLLLKYLKIKETQTEKYESIDMMRLLENGINVRMVETKFLTKSVDTVKDLNLVRKLLKNAK